MCIEDEARALKAFRESVGDSIVAEFEYLPQLERKGSVKLRFVVSDVGRRK